MSAVRRAVAAAAVSAVAAGLLVATGCGAGDPPAEEVSTAGGAKEAESVLLEQRAAVRVLCTKVLTTVPDALGASVSVRETQFEGTGCREDLAETPRGLFYEVSAEILADPQTRDLQAAVERVLTADGFEVARGSGRWGWTLTVRQRDVTATLEAFPGRIDYDASGRCASFPAALGGQDWLFAHHDDSLPLG